MTQAEEFGVELRAHEGREEGRLAGLEARLAALEAVMQQINGGVRVLMGLGMLLGMAITWIGVIKDHVSFH